MKYVLISEKQIKELEDALKSCVVTKYDVQFSDFLVEEALAIIQTLKTTEPAASQDSVD